MTRLAFGFPWPLGQDSSAHLLVLVLVFIHLVSHLFFHSKHTLSTSVLDSEEIELKVSTSGAVGKTFKGASNGPVL